MRSAEPDVARCVRTAYLSYLETAVHYFEDEAEAVVGRDLPHDGTAPYDALVGRP